jgi:hypothetical protein
MSGDEEASLKWRLITRLLQGSKLFFPLTTSVLHTLLLPADPWWGSGNLQGRTPYPHLGRRACNVADLLRRICLRCHSALGHGPLEVSSGIKWPRVAVVGCSVKYRAANPGPRLVTMRLPSRLLHCGLPLVKSDQPLVFSKVSMQV